MSLCLVSHWNFSYFHWKLWLDPHSLKMAVNNWHQQSAADVHVKKPQNHQPVFFCTLLFRGFSYTRASSILSMLLRHHDHCFVYTQTVVYVSFFCFACSCTVQRHWNCAVTKLVHKMCIVLCFFFRREKSIKAKRVVYMKKSEIRRKQRKNFFFILMNRKDWI